MTKQSEEEMMKFFVKAFEEVLLPILERHEEKLTSLDKSLGGVEEKIGGLDKRVGSLEEKMVSLQETLDAHTASLMELEKLPNMIGEIYKEVKDIRPVQRDHEERIIKLERKVVNL